MTDPVSLMHRFAEETGLIGDKQPDRYLWTDAFAVCNYITLSQTEKDQSYLDLAVNLVEQVHYILGRHRDDDPRMGWLGSEESPTKGGLRIGKPEPERPKSESLDRMAEWEKDGQYFHYLTKWMHSLIQVYKELGDSKYLKYALDLAKATSQFIDNSRMYWKMSIDLSYPQVPSMGKHDPLDGYITFQEINQYNNDQDLISLISNMKEMISAVDLRTTDPLGLGGLLFDIYRFKIMDQDHELQQQLIEGVEWGLKRVRINHGLAFRELGLAIGLQAAEELDLFSGYYDQRDSIIDYWQQRNNFNQHRQINTVMLATSLAPYSFLRV